MSEIKVKPARNYMMVEKYEEEQKTDSGIVMPEKANSINNSARIVKKGPLVSEDLNEGDIVYLADFTGKPIKYLGTVYLLIKETEIIATKED